MATEQAWARFANLPSNVAANLPLVAAMGIVNTVTDMIVGPPNEVSNDFWDPNSLQNNAKDSLVVSMQDIIKFAISRWTQPIGLVPINPPVNGADGAQAFHSAYY